MDADLHGHLLDLSVVRYRLILDTNLLSPRDAFVTFAR
jgi:hypothetical protein